MSRKPSLIEGLIDEVVTGIARGVGLIGDDDCPECDGAEQEAEREESDDYSTPCHLCNGTGKAPSR